MTFAGMPFWAVAAIAAGCAGALAVLHLLRVRPRPVRVITTLFWAHAAERTRARTLLERFRHPLTYVLLLLICVLIALALGRPEPSVPRPERITTALVLSAGGSMQARDTEAGGSRFEAAIAALLDEARALSSDDSLVVVVADPLPRVVHAFDDPRPALAPRLSQVRPADLPALDSAAVALARSLVAGRPNPRITLITDRPTHAALAKEGPDGPSVRVVRVGEPAPNVAIVSAMFEPGPDSGLVGGFHVRVGSWSSQASAVRVRVHRAGGAPLLDETRSVAPGSTADFTVPGLRADGDELVADVSGQDALQVDNRVTFRLPLRRRIDVGVAKDVPRAVRLLLDSSPDVNVADASERCDVHVVCGDPAIDSSAPAIVVVGGEQPTGARQAIRTSGQTWLVRDLAFEDALCGGAGLDELPEDATVLLASNQSALAAMTTVQGSRRLLLSRSLVADDATASRQPALAIFLLRAVRHLAGWQPDPIVLSPERSLKDPLFAARLGDSATTQVMSGSRSSGDLTAAIERAEAEAPAARWSMPAPFEILLFLALALAALEAVLHVRGKIS